MSTPILKPPCSTFLILSCSEAYVYGSGENSYAPTAVRDMQAVFAGGAALSPAGDLRRALEREEGRRAAEPAYFYHTDHLGSTTLLTDSTGDIVQALSYLPYGEDWSEYNEVPPPDSARLGQYRFNGKERDPETGFLYYGQRYHGISIIPTWLSVDPMMDKYPSISPYAYCNWNPVRYVDPDGMEIDDYFSKTGVYLGYDNAKTDNVRIIDEALWNDLSQGGKIEHSAGYAASQSFSSASISMSDEAQLEVYRHYNTTNCELYAASSNTSPNNSGMVTRTKNNISKIGIYLKGNFKGIAVADHSSEIINMFVHEEQHVVDHRGGTFIFDYEYENSALMTQFNHSSWLNCRPEFRRAVVNYGRKVSTLPPFVLDFWDPYTNPFE